MLSFTEPAFELVGGALCLDLINTLGDRFDPERQRELLTTYKELLAFALQSNAVSTRDAKFLIRLAGQHPREASGALCELIRLRECLNRIFRPIAADMVPTANDLKELSSFVQDALSHLLLRRDHGNIELDWPEPKSDLKFLQWRAARSAADLLISPEAKWVRLCECDWFFVDRSRNHSRRWCDMKVCGNREKVRRFYARTRKKS